MNNSLIFFVLSPFLDRRGMFHLSHLNPRAPMSVLHMLQGPLYSAPSILRAPNGTLKVWRKCGDSV